jgi:predicted alpha/beta hydrolase family esterase
MTRVLIFPGIGNSGPEHWQTRWQASSPDFERVEVPDWDRPQLADWLAALERAVAAGPLPVIAAHSLACLAVTHWAARGGQARGALLVAIPDPAAAAFPAVAASFGPVSLEPLSFPSRVVASRNDPYCSFEFAAECARRWGSELIDAGNAGHINAESKLGDWPQGRALLNALF